MEQSEKTISNGLDFKIGSKNLLVQGEEDDQNETRVTKSKRPLSKSRDALVFFLLLLASLLVLSGLSLVFNYTRRVYARRRQIKLNLLNYSNLIETEFDA